MQRKFEEGSTEWQMFEKFWELCKNFCLFQEEYGTQFARDLSKALRKIPENDVSKSGLREVFTDYWKLCQALWEPEQEDEYWEDVMHQIDFFYKKYKTPFAKYLAVALANDLDRRSRE